MKESRAIKNAKKEIVSTLIGRKKNNIWVEYGTYGKEIMEHQHQQANIGLILILIYL